VGTKSTLLRQGNLNEERTAWQFLFVTSITFAPDFPLVRLDDACCDRQPQPRSAAFEFSSAGGVQFHLANLIKLFKDHVLVFIIDADAGILDADLAYLTMVPFDCSRADVDRAAIRREFDGIDMPFAGVQNPPGWGEQN